MPRFYFHIRYDGCLTADVEGVEMADLDAAKQDAMLSAREILADALKSGKRKLPEAFVINDDAGATLHTLLFSTVLRTAF